MRGSRPSGTDGSDFAYRMTIEPRFKRAVQARLLLRKYLTVQGVVQLSRALWAVLLYEADAPFLTVTSCVVAGFAVLIGTWGLKRNSPTLLRIYVAATLVALLLSLVPVFSGEVASKLSSDWDSYRQSGDYGALSISVPEAALVLFSTMVQIMAAFVTSSLLQHMKPTKTAQ